MALRYFLEFSRFGSYNLLIVHSSHTHTLYTVQWMSNYLYICTSSATIYTTSHTLYTPLTHEADSVSSARLVWGHSTGQVISARVGSGSRPPSRYTRHEHRTEKSGQNSIVTWIIIHWIFVVFRSLICPFSSLFLIGGYYKQTVELLLAANYKQ